MRPLGRCGVRSVDPCAPQVFVRGGGMLCLLAMYSVEVPTSLVVLGSISLALIAAAVLAEMFGPSPRYEIARPEELRPNESEEFLGLVESLADAKLNRRGWKHRPVTERAPELLG